MKMKKYFVGMMLVASVLCVTACGEKTKNAETAEQTTNSSIKYEPQGINFPEFMGELAGNIEIENTVKSEDIKNKEALNSAYVTTYMISEEKKNDLVEKLGFGAYKDKETYKDGVYSYPKTGIGSLQIYDNGGVSVLYNDIKCEDEVTFSDEEAIELATKFLKENGLYEDDFECTYFGKEEVGDDGEEILVLKSVGFSRILNGNLVDGNYTMEVGLNAQGEVKSMKCIYLHELEEQEIEQENIKDIVSNVQELMKEPNYFNMNEGTTRIIIENIEVELWEDALCNARICEPVYRLTGKAFDGEKEVEDFEIITSALKK